CARGRVYYDYDGWYFDVW
nr:immunoglobulin heavy chain junction region [Mus musculus]NSM05066.1 immunoglobulin heavy chain junction region [Mus musculus]NSM07470.1 immunoglobulin heavy chain junction region [Mus musculus]NSM07797.1 immunoglobulin heavy chain junction region [Mus musculus]NSM08413.1 immunoglobulin heavy chain junction region [Mus musculus]